MAIIKSVRCDDCGVTCNANIIYRTLYGRSPRLGQRLPRGRESGAESDLGVFDCHQEWLQFWATGRYEGFVYLYLTAVHVVLALSQFTKTLHLVLDVVTCLDLVLVRLKFTLM